MRNRLVYTLFVVPFCLGALPTGLWAYGGGTGTPEEPYLIHTAEHLNAIGAEPNDWDKHFRLMADIDLSVYEPNQLNLIGIYRVAQDPNESLKVPFSGVFDGQGHTIANFTYAVRGDEDPADGWVRGIGLFRFIDGARAQIIDLTLVDPNLFPLPTCTQRVGAVGAIAGVVRSGLITGCRVEGGQIQADGGAGGLAGWARRYWVERPPDLAPTLSHCSTHCQVLQASPRPFVDAERADFYLHQDYGGLLGFNSALMSDCNATGSVSGGQCAGGLVGYNGGDITLCHATGPVSGASHVGGLVGEAYYGTISSSWASGHVTGPDEALVEEAPSGIRGMGGLVGSCLRVTVSDCHASGNVTGQSHVGGLAGGCHEGTIQRCYATGSVTATDQQAGGLLGSTGPNAVISECYASAVVSVRWAGGGLVGLNGGTIRTSWAAGHVSGVTGVGGLAGENWKWVEMILGVPVEYDGAITDCYALTDVICEESRAGGLVGEIQGGTVLRCFAAGLVIGPMAVGGLVGTENAKHPSQVTQSFWDMDATGLGYSAQGWGLTTQQMQERTTYVDAGWDFADETVNGTDDVWWILEGQNYPRLWWELTEAVVD